MPAPQVGDEKYQNMSTGMELPTSNVPASHLAHRRQLATRTFAGRVGGNQKYDADPDAYDTHQPDASPLSSLESVIAIKSFASVELWRMALLEGLGSGLFNFALGALASGFLSSDLSMLAQVVLASLLSWFGLALFVYCLAPVTGGQLTPVITMTTFFIGLTTLPRALLYITAQTIGALVAGYWLKIALGDNYFAKGIVPGCSVIPGKVSPGQLFVLEYTFCLILIFLACGLGLDPRQHSTISPSVAPMLIGLALAVVNTCSAFAAPGYTGMSFNPARCLGLMTPMGHWQHHHVHWLGPLAAAITNGIIYRIVPPWIGK